MILYIPDYKMTSDERYQAQKCLIDNFDEAIVCEPDFNCPEEAIAGIQDTVQECCPDVIIAQGLAAHIVLSACKGTNRICILDKSQMFDNKDTLTQDVQEEYHKFRYTFEKENLLEGIDEETHPWCIFGTNHFPDRLTLSAFKSRVMTVVGESIINQELIDRAISPIIETMEKCSWFDDDGVHYTNYGKNLDYVRDDIFNQQSVFEIPPYVRSVQPNVLEGSNLRELIITDSIDVLPRCMCRNSRLLSRVTIDSPNLWKIGESCFEGCSSLKSLNLSNTNVQVIENYAFANSGLEQVTLPNSIRHCSASAFPPECKVTISVGKLIGLMKSNEDFIRSLEN